MQTRALAASSRGGRIGSERGFTLIELLVTIALVAILAGIALPSYREFTIRTNTTNTTNNLVGALNTARSEAVKRGRTVAVVAYTGQWKDGWQVVAAKETAAGVIEAVPESPGSTAADCAGYLDDAVTDTNTVPLCMQHYGAIPDGYEIHSVDDAAAAPDSVVFSPTGALVGTNSVDFSVCRPVDHADPKQSRRIHVGAGGPIDTRRDTTGAPAGDCN